MGGDMGMEGDMSLNEIVLQEPERDMMMARGRDQV